MNLNKYGKALSWITRPKSTETATLENFNPEEFRTPFQGAGLVDHGPPGVRQGYAKATVDDPTQGVKVGDELGDNIYQRQGGYELQMGSGDNRITRHRQSLDKIKAYKDQVISEGWEKKPTGPKGEVRAKDIFKDELFEQYFDSELKQTKGIHEGGANTKLKKAIADLPENATLKQKWEHLLTKDSAFQQGVIRPFLRKFKGKYKRDAGYLSLKQLADFTEFSKPTLTEAFFFNDKYKGVLPDVTKVGPAVVSKAKRGFEIVKELEDIGIIQQKIPGTYRASPTGKFKGHLALRLFNLPNDDQIVKLRDIVKMKGEESPTLRSVISKASKNSPEYLKMEYRKDRGNMNKLLKVLNASVKDLDEVELLKMIKNNPALEEMVTANFNSITGANEPVRLDDLTFNEMKSRVGFEKEHVRSFKTAKIDPITQKVLDGFDIEYPKHLRISIKSFNHPFKEAAEKWVQSNIKNINDPIVKGKIDKIDNFFTKFGQAYTIVDPTTNKRVIRGATDSNLLKNIQALGFTGEEKMFKPELLASIKERLQLMQEFCGYAGGGRVSLKAGSCPANVAARNFARASEDLVQGRVTGEAGQELAEKIGRVSGKAPKSLLTKLLGPYGIGIDVVFEAGSIGTDVLKGKPLNEAIADNWIIGTPYKKFTGKTGQKLFNERLAKLDSSTKLYGDTMNLGADIEDLEQKLASQEKDI